MHSGFLRAVISLPRLNTEGTMKTNRSNAVGRPLARACGIGLAVFISAAGSLPAQDGDKKEERLKEVEKQVQELTKAVKELKAEEPKIVPASAASNPSASTPASKDQEIVLDPKWLGALTWRSIGPANMSGRIVDLAVVESDPMTYWVATASGGLVKTTNNGVTFVHQFDREATVSIGSVAVAPSDPNIVWVGTGENNPRNSVSYGDGVYKSTNGGKTWKNMELKKTFQIGRVVIHPKNPNIVYVGALGRLWGPNEERGVFKTTDAGETWEKVLYVDDKSGVIDMRIHPTEPETLLAAFWQVQRDGFDSHPGDPPPEGFNGYDPMKKWGPGSGLYKTTDGGKNWRRLTNGLPTCNMGRIGLDYYLKDPNSVFVIIDTEKYGMGDPPRSGAAVYIGAVGEDADNGARLTRVVENSPGAKAGLRVDDVVQSMDDKAIKTGEQFSEEIRSRKIGDKLKLKVLREGRPQEIAVTLERRPETQTSTGVYLGATGEDGEEGVKLTGVVEDSPAAKAGLKVGDIVQSIGSKSIQGYNQLLEDVRTRNAGDKVKIKVLRDEQSQEIEVTLAERAGGARGGGPGGRRATAASGVYVGITGEDAEGGVRLTSVVENGPAAKAGLKSGDLVQAIDEKSIEKYDQLIEEIRTHKNGDKLKFKFKREEQTQLVEVTVAERSQTTAGVMGGASRTRPNAASLAGQMENVQDDQGTNSFEYGGIYKSTDGGETWKRINSLNPRPIYFSQVRVDPSDDRLLYALGIQLWRSTNGGQTFRADGGRGIHADQHTLWINPRDGRHMLIGTDGGWYATYDRAANWDHLNTMALGQFYHIAIAPKQPYYVAGGLQDNGSWMGPTIGLSGTGPINEDWLSVGGGDGFVCRVDPNDPDVVYWETQDGGISRRNLRTGERASLRPPRPDGAPPYRFNWNTPFILSHQNSRILYCAGNYVFRSLDRGNNLQIISPEITLTKRGSASALAESPKNPNVLYAGTDDGALWMTRDGGKNWTNITRNVGLPKSHWVSSIEPSRYVEGRAYVAFDGHRADVDDPLVYVTEDFGKTWKSIGANLPWGSTRVLREDVSNPNLLVVGTEFGAWFSLDRGKYWNRSGTNLPTVAVHEFAFHPNNGEVVAATHGRSLWVLDISALRQVKAEHLASKPALYKPESVVRWRSEPVRGRTNRRFVGQNPTPGAQIYYSLPQKAEKVALKIVDISGATIREFQPKSDAGFYRLAWDLRAAARQTNATGTFARNQRPGETTNTTARGGSGARGNIQRSGGSGNRAGGSGTAEGEGANEIPSAGGQRRGGAGGSGGRGGGATVTPGTYRIVLNVDGQEFAQNIRVEPDPLIADVVTAFQDALAEEESEREERHAREAELEEEQEREREIRDRKEIL
jgi:S1-C subfamily serine protease/photosystem II stability/assembly factor-like uncharacterized protein